MTNRIAFDLGNGITVSPPLCPNSKVSVQPGDLSQFAPFGNGVYGYQNGLKFDPLKTSPSQEPSGGVVYFGCDVANSDFLALLRLLSVNADPKDYAVFTEESQNPGTDGYLVQMRIVSRFALRFMFGAIEEGDYDKFPEQNLSVGKALLSFMETEKRRWGTSFTEDGRGLAGLFGGDGDYAREELAFGFLLENEYHDVYRIWSRAWLVTK